MTKTATLRNWRMGEDDCLVGQVYNHDTIPDGTEIRTSRVAKFEPGCGWAVTYNTKFYLEDGAHDEKR